MVSCVFALGVNISNYLVLGKTSPLTYQVLGHLKTVLILVLGFTVFNVRRCPRIDIIILIVCCSQKPVDMRNLLGIVVAMFG